MKFTVQNTRIGGVVDGRWVETPAFKAVGYQGVGVNFPVESQATVDKAEAEDWAARASAGEDVPEAKFGSYSDD
jgi:hypothetical protein